MSRPRHPRPSDSRAGSEPDSRLRQVAPWVALVVLLAIGLWVRVYLAATPGYTPDLKWFYAWADAAHREDVGAPYRLPGRLASNYPPGYLLVLSRVPWLYETVTGETFRPPPDPNTRQMDEVDLALSRLGSRRQLAKTRDLVEHYKRHDPSRYQAILEARLNPELVALGLVPPRIYQALAEAATKNPEQYHKMRARLAPLIRARIERDLPYDPPDRLRRLAVWIKLPALLFDLAGAAVLFVLLRRRIGPLGGLAVGGVYLFLPAVLYDSACWGQVDAVHSLLMLLCLAALVAGHAFLVGLIFTVALLTKFQSIVILPVVAAGLLRRWRDEFVTLPDAQGPNHVVRSFALVLAGTLLAAGLILLPFIVTGTADEALATYGKAAGQYHWVSVCAFNPWWFFNSKPGLPQWYYRFIDRDDQPFLGPITARHVGLLLLASFSLWVMWLVYRRGCTYETIAAAGAAMAMGFFVLPTEIHERYGFPAMILTAYLVGAGWRHLPVLLILSVAQFYNFAAVQPIEDPQFQWLMPVANVLEHRGGMTGLLVLIHVACLVYFVTVLYRLPVRLVPPGRSRASSGQLRAASRSSRPRARR